MWFYAVVLALAVSNVIAVSSPQECAEDIDPDSLMAIASSPGADELEVLCPAILGFFECVDDFVKNQIGLTIRDLSNSALIDSETRRGVTLLVNINDLLVDVCDENTELGKTYRQHSACFKSIPQEKILECALEAESAYTAYQELKNEIEHESHSQFSSKEKCMQLAYAHGCLAAEIHEKCGEEAHQLNLDIVKRSSLFRNLLCTESDLQELKTNFLDNLEGLGEKKSFFAQAFDLRRRRKK